jgi:hypothetical protein
VDRRAPQPLSVAAALLLAAAPALLWACGKKGLPLPPIRVRPAAAREVALRQVGEDVVLTALLPDRRTDGTPLDDGLEARILRMAAGPGLRPGTVSGRFLARQFEKGAREVARLSGDALRAAAPDGRLLFRDEGAAVGAPPSRHLYSVVVLDAQGRRSDLTPPVAIETVAVAPAPRRLTAEVAEGQVRLAWEAPDAREDRRYNVYRRLASEPREPDRPLHPEPLAGTAYVDETFRYGETYRYSVRTLATRVRPPRESASSDEVEVRPIDVYPPEAPGGLAVAAEGAVVKVYWFPNGEPDLGGYRIYRRATPDGAFALLGQVGPAETSFVDAGAVPGVRYDYVVTAIDTSVPPNESPRSEERSEMLPPARAPREDPAPGGATRPPGGRRR